MSTSAALAERIPAVQGNQNSSFFRHLIRPQGNHQFMLDDRGRELKPNGVTFYAQLQGGNRAVISMAICMEKDVYNKAIGRTITIGRMDYDQYFVVNDYDPLVTFDANMLRVFVRPEQMKYGLVGFGYTSRTLALAYFMLVNFRSQK